MLKVIVGYIPVDSEEVLQEMLEIIYDSDCCIESESEDCIEISNIDPEAMLKLFNDGYITESDYNEIESLDHIHFHL